MIPYKQHYACFECRKTFKRRLLKDINRNANSDDSFDAKCPECGNLMADMGLDFKSPKKTDIKAWNHLKSLFNSGVTFHSCGCSGPGYIPKDKKSLIKFLEEKKQQFVEHQRFWATYKEPGNARERIKSESENVLFYWFIPANLKSGTKKKQKVDVQQAIIYWANKIKDIDEKVNALNLI